MLDHDAVEQSQTQLLRRIAAQDRQALAEFYDQTAPVLFANAMRVLGDPHDAEEVVQDVFVQIWNKAATFDPLLGAPFHWALGITRNRAIDRLRKRQRRSRVLEELAVATTEAPVAPPSQSDFSLNEEDSAAVRFAVNSLPTDQRQAIELAFFGGLTHAEIAENLNAPLGTVKARIRRGMLKLRDTLRAYT